MKTQMTQFFNIQQVRDGVYAAIVRDGAGALGNSSIIDLGDRTLVFDTTQSLAAAIELRARHGTVRR